MLFSLLLFDALGREGIHSLNTILSIKHWRQNNHIPSPYHYQYSSPIFFDAVGRGGRWFPSPGNYHNFLAVCWLLCIRIIGFWLIIVCWVLKCKRHLLCWFVAACCVFARRLIGACLVQVINSYYNVPLSRAQERQCLCHCLQPFRSCTECLAVDCLTPSCANC